MNHLSIQKKKFEVIFEELNDGLMKIQWLDA